MKLFAIVVNEDDKVNQVEQKDHDHELVVTLYLLQRSPCLKAQALPLQVLKEVNDTKRLQESSRG